MITRVRPVLTGVGFVLLCVSIPWQLLLAVWDVAQAQVDLESSFARSVMIKAIADNLPQAVFDMAVGGGLLILCNLDKRLEQGRA